MTRTRLLTLLILAAVGYGTLALLFPRYDVSSRIGQTFDRAHAVAEARLIASRFGVDATTWRAFVSSSFQRDNDEYLRRHPESRAEAWLTPLKTEVTLVSPDRRTRATVEFAAGGRWTGFSLRLPGGPPPRRPGPPGDGDRIGFQVGRRGPPPNRQAANTPAAPDANQPDVATDTATARPIADQSVAALLGDDAARFTFTAENDQGKDGRRFTWTSKPTGQSEQAAGTTRDPLKFTAEVVVQGTQVREARVRPSFDSAFIDSLRNRPRTLGILSAAAVFTLGSFALIAALILFFFGLSRRELDWRLTLRFFAVALAALLTANGLDGMLDDLRRDVGGEATSFFVASVMPWLLYVGINIALALFGVVLWGAGHALSLNRAGSTHVSLAALLRGKITARKVAAPLAAGLLLGGVVAALPYLVAALAPGGLFVDTESVNTLVSASVPALAALVTPFGNTVTVCLIIVFAFAAPAIHSALNRPTLARVLTLLAAILMLLETDLFRGQPVGPTLTVVVLFAVAFDQIYRRFDLLAALVASLAGVAALRALSLVVQPAPPLRSAGVTALVVLGLLTVAALVVSWKGRDLPIEADELAARRAAPGRAERERLRAEFGVARKAQQQMLPAAPPQVEGFSLSARCNPAREVGGDLYDFIPLPESRLGIVVADVSGKGVPAALYMTLTKGLLLSVSEVQSDPGEILREVNKHLYEVCRRKMFVTLFFGVLDPASRTLTYARAGHNPPVWRQAANGQTTLLRAPGLGLGLNAGKSFDKILAVERVQLAPNDSLILYSDGITEAMNAKGEEYGEIRLMSLAMKADRLSADETRDLVLFDVNAFLGKVAPQDDQTLVVVRVN